MSENEFMLCRAASEARLDAYQQRFVRLLLDCFLSTKTYTVNINMAGSVRCASNQPWVSDVPLNMMLLDFSDDMDMSDLLSLRHGQRLENAKEYTSILAEPLGSRLRARFVD